jgi:putative ABC transport system permease protein
MFVLKMAWRDSRASRRRLLACALSVVFGIGALVALGSFSAGLGRAVEAQAKGLLGADLVVSARAEPSEAARQYIASLGGIEAVDQSFSTMMAFPSSGGALRLVQVHALEGGFPFYGRMITAPPEAAERLRAGGRVAVLETSLLRQFGAKVGDPVKLGRGIFVIVGALESMPGETLGASMFAPRAIIPRSALSGTGLTGFGSLARHSLALKLPPATDAGRAGAALQAKFPAEHFSIETAEGRERSLGRTMANIHIYLGLVGFVSVLLGAIGLAGALQVHVRQKMAGIALLRCLGASARQGFSIYLTQALALGVIGSACGAALGVGLQLALLEGSRGLLPFRVDFSVAWSEVGRGAASGLAMCVLFTLWPLMRIRRVSPLGALRAAEAEVGDAGSDPWRWALGAAIAAALVAIAIGQTRSVRIGFGFAAMLGLAFGTLSGAALAVAWGARRVPRRLLPYTLRQALANLYRPYNRTVALLLSLGLGTFLVLTVYLVHATLLGEIDSSAWGSRTNLLFFDVQDDEIGPLASLLASAGAPVVQQVPVVTMRIASIAGRRVEDLANDKTARIPGWTLEREYRSTYRSGLAGDERVVAGVLADRAPPAGGAALTPISVEEGLFRSLRLRLGDEIDWNVQGMPVRTRVTGVRSVEWRRLEPNFFVVFPEGSLDGAPRTFMAAVRAERPADSARLQAAVAQAFPNVSAIDLSVVINALDGIFSRLALAVEFVALFTAATGLVVLASAVYSGRRQRFRESALLRTLGATGAQLTRIEIAESAILGVLGGLIGSGLALAANGLLARWVFDARPASPPLALLAALAAVTAVTLGTVWVAGRGTSRQPPLDALRAES